MKRGRKRKIENVAGCKLCTRVDDKGDRFRIRDCGPGCGTIRAGERGLPLTKFLIKLQSYTDENLKQASPAKAAQVYGIKRKFAAEYIRLEQEVRGLR